VRKAIGILLMATLMAICFTAAASPAIAGVSTTYITSDVTPGLAPIAATIDQAGQEVIASASISKPVGAMASIENLHLATIGVNDKPLALSVRSLGAAPFRMCS